MREVKALAVAMCRLGGETAKVPSNIVKQFAPSANVVDRKFRKREREANGAIQTWRNERRASTPSGSKASGTRDTRKS